MSDNRLTNAAAFAIWIASALEREKELPDPRWEELRKISGGKEENYTELDEFYLNTPGAELSFFEIMEQIEDIVRTHYDFLTATQVHLIFEEIRRDGRAPYYRPEN